MVQKTAEPTGNRPALSAGTGALSLLDRPIPGAGHVSRAAQWIGALTGWKRLLLAVLSGALASLAMAPFNAVPVLIVSFTLLVWQIDGLGRWQRRLGMAALLGWAFGVGFFGAGLHWIGNAFLVDKDMFGALMPFAMVLLAAGMGLFTAAAVALARRFWTTGPSRVGVFALAWILIEWVRGWIFTGFPWHLAGYAWTAILPMMQSVALFGIYGLSLLTVLAAAAPAVLTDCRTGTAGPGARRGLFWLAAPWAILAMLTVWGTVRLADGGPKMTGITVRLVQPSVPQIEKMNPGNAADIYRRHMDLTREPGLDTAGFIIWPEAAVPVLVSRHPEILSDIGGLLHPGQYFILGSARYVEARGVLPERYYNSLHVIAPGGEIVATYDKHTLVPFGEYLPFGDLIERFGLTKLVGGQGSYSPGKKLQTLQLSGAPDFGPLICYEAIFPGRVVDPAKRPQWLLNLTDDTWFGTDSGPRQHFAIARTRAIEEGLPLVRAANNGISAIIDPKGRILRSLGTNKIGVLDGELPAPALPTLQARFGQLILFLLASGLSAIVILTRLRTESEAW